MTFYEIPVEYSDNSPVLRHEFDKYGLAQRKALIRYYFKENPTNVTHLLELWGELVFALQFDGKIKVSKPQKG